MHYKTETDYVVCPNCHYATAEDGEMRFCPRCGCGLDTGFNPQMNGFGGQRGRQWEPPRPGEPGFTEFWSQQNVAADDFGSAVGGAIVLGLAVVGGLAIINALKNDKKRLQGD